MLTLVAVFKRKGSMIRPVVLDVAKAFALPCTSIPDHCDMVQVTPFLYKEKTMHTSSTSILKLKKGNKNKNKKHYLVCFSCKRCTNKYY